MRLIPLICTLVFSGIANGQDTNPCKTGGQTCFFGVEINGVLCGYSIETNCDGMLYGKKISFEYSDVILKMSLLGADLDEGFKMLYAIDTASQQAVQIEVNIINGQSVSNSLTEIRDDTAYFSNFSSGVSKAIPAGKDVIFSSQTRYPHLFEDFIRNDASQKKYRVYDPLRGEITEKSYTRKSEEDIMLADSLFHTLVLEETDLSTGVKTTMWLNTVDGYNLKSIAADRIHIYLSDESVTRKITMADMNELFFAKVGKVIPEIMTLSWIKVQATINSYGENLSAALLNSHGQKFDGTVKGSLIEGVFEVEPVRYNGKNAPSFPPGFSNSPELKKYLESEFMIESNDPLIISEATRITAGSKDSWEAAVRLSKWVAENIAGALPGGVSAINSLKMREAECGGHSRLLAALCRAVGIPARMVVGCMYTTNYSGSFGQHAWTEVYMGNGGWIPVDATISEINYINAGHIRLGENASFRPVKMEIVGFRSGLDSQNTGISDSFDPMIGSYMNIDQYRMFKIIHKAGVLAIDIPGRIVLDLNPPDDQGRWYPKLTRDLSLSTENTADGKVDRIFMWKHSRLRKMTAPGANLTGIPPELTKLTGNYQSVPEKLSLDVMFTDGSLTTQEPTGKSKERIVYLKKGDIWIDKTGNYEIGFTENSENEITGMNLAVKTEFQRGEPVTTYVEPVIKESGIDAGLKKYEEIKKYGNNGYLFSVHMLHQIGHSLLRENRIDDAIKIFEKNVKEYPESFMANDALAETYLLNGREKLALKYFIAAVKINPDYEYGREKIKELKNK